VLDVAFGLSGHAKGRGLASKPVDVDPQEFVRYCAAEARDYNLDALVHFAHQKGMGNKY
jgi:hypothetical protein